MRKKVCMLLALLLLVGCLAGCGSKADKNEPITSLEQLNNKEHSIGVGMGTSSVRDAGNVFPKAEVIEYNSVEDGYLAVQVGTLDAFVYSRASMEYAMASGSLKGVHLLEENVGEGTNVVVGISRKTEIPDLEARINAFIDEIHADGTMDDIYDRWVNRGVSTMPDIPEPEHPDCRITVGTSGTADRFSYYENGELVGSDLELIRRFASYMNAELELVVLDYIQLSAAAETGMVDCVFANLHATPEREEAMGFSKPLYVLENGVMVRGDDTDPVKALCATPLNELDIKKIGVMTGSIHEAIAQERFPDAEISYYNNNSDLAVALNSGLIDAFSCGGATGKTITDENPGLVLMDEPAGVIDCSYAFPKTEDGKALCDQMSEYILKIKASGELDAMHKAWNEDGFKENIELPAAPEGGRTLIFATTGETTPFSFLYNGAVTGYDVAMAADFCRAYGYGMEIETLDFSGVIPGLNGGMYDFAGNCITVTPEREQSVYFSEANHVSEVVLMMRKPETSAAGSDLVPRYNSLSEMRGKNISLGIEVGSYFEEITKQEFPKAELQYFDTVSDIANSIAAGKLDGFIVDEPVARLMCSNSPKLACIEEPLETNSYACIFPKTPEGAALCDEVSEFIRQCKADGTMDQIINAWLTDDVAAQRTDYASLSGENGTVRMAASFEAPPFGFFRDGECVGMDLDLMIRFCEAKGYALELSVTTFSAIIPSLGTTCDIGVDAFCITPERAEQVLFSEPYYVGGTLMVVGTQEASAAEELSFWQGLAASFEKTFVREQRWKLIVEGIGTTVFISFFSALFGTILGFGICMLRRTRSKAVFAATTVYIRILQGTPLVVLLMVLYYLVFPKSGLPGEWVAVVAFTLNFAAYVSEMIRTGIAAVDIGQTEAALALGFTKSRAFFKFILPQAAQHFLPVYKGEFISLVKMTSIVGYIAVQDLTKMSDIIRSRTYEAFFPLIATAIIYFIISGLLSSLLRLVEVKAEPDRKNRTVKGVEMQ